jgi:hypothetical protein
MMALFPATLLLKGGIYWVPVAAPTLPRSQRLPRCDRLFAWRVARRHSFSPRAWPVRFTALPGLTPLPCPRRRIRRANAPAAFPAPVSPTARHVMPCRVTCCCPDCCHAYAQRQAAQPNPPPTPPSPPTPTLLSRGSESNPLDRVIFSHAPFARPKSLGLVKSNSARADLSQVLPTVTPRPRPKG